MPAEPATTGSTEPPAPDEPAHRRSAGLRRERSLASRQFADGVFHNTQVTPVGVQGGFLPMFGELLFGGQERRPPAPLPLERP